MSAFSSVPNTKTIVIKIGTDSIAPKGTIDENVIDAISSQMVDLRRMGHKILLVSSGAVAAGRQELGIEPTHKLTLVEKAAVAGIGQHVLMRLYDAALKKHGDVVVAQGLLENAHFKRPRSTSMFSALANRLHFRRSDMKKGVVFKEVLDFWWSLKNVLPVLNANDVMSLAELKPLKKNNPDDFSDNDGLARLSGNLVKADKLIIGSTHCVHQTNPTTDPKARPVTYLNCADKQAFAAISTNGSSSGGTGGMYNKLQEVKAFLKEGYILGTPRTAHIISSEDLVKRSALWNIFNDIWYGTELVYRPNCSKTSSALRLG